MSSTANPPLRRLEFAPPKPPGLLRAFSLAVMAHLALLAALTWGVQWRSKPTEFTAEAELWSQLPQQAAPRLEESTPQPEVRPAPLPPPVPDPVERAEKPATPPSIVMERDKQRQAEEKKRKEGMARLEEQKFELLRQENIKRMAGLAGASGPAASTGTALQSSGPSASYSGRIAARIKANIVFADVVSGNPRAEVQIRVAPDGTIVSRRLITSSGVKAWDEAVLRAIDKTEVLPRDADGKVVPEFPIGFRPND